MSFPAYFQYRVKERSLSGATCRLYLNVIRFLYLQVLKQPTFDVTFQIPKKLYRIPELLTRGEVGQILSAVSHSKHRIMMRVITLLPPVRWTGLT